MNTRKKPPIGVSLLGSGWRRDDSLVQFAQALF